MSFLLGSFGWFGSIALNQPFFIDSDCRFGNTITKQLTMEEFKISKGRLIFYIFSVLIIAFVVYHFSEVEKFVTLFKSLNPLWIIAAVVAQSLTYVSIGFMYKSLIRSSIPGVSLLDFAKLSIVMAFMNHTLPSGGVSGNSIAFHFFVSRGLGAARSLSLILLQMISSYSASIFIVIISVLAFATFIGPLPSTFYYIVIAGIIFFVLLMTATSILGSKKGVLFLYKRIHKFRWVEKILKNWNMTPEEMHDSIDNMEYSWHMAKREPKVYLLAALGFLGVYIFDALTVYALFSGLGFSIHPVIVFTTYIMMAIVGSIPISPGSLLVYEGGMTFLFTLVGVPLHIALAVTLMYRGLSFWVPIPVGLFFSHRLVLSDNKPQINGNVG